MATIEERVQALEREQKTLEQEHTELKKAIELQTEEIAALKAQLSKVDLLAIDNRNIRQSLGRIETNQESTKLDFERQEKRSVRFERQTSDQLTDIKEQLANLSGQQIEEDGKIVGLQTEMRQRFTEQQTEMRQRFTEQDSKITEHTALLQQILARLPEK